MTSSNPSEQDMTFFSIVKINLYSWETITTELLQISSLKYGNLFNTLNCKMPTKSLKISVNNTINGTKILKPGTIPFQVFFKINSLTLNCWRLLTEKSLKLKLSNLILNLKSEN